MQRFKKMGTYLSIPSIKSEEKRIKNKRGLRNFQGKKGEEISLKFIILIVNLKR